LAIDSNGQPHSSSPGRIPCKTGNFQGSSEFSGAQLVFWRRKALGYKPFLSRFPVQSSRELVIIEQRIWWAKQRPAREGLSHQSFADGIRRSLATELLENTHMSVDQVVERVGFADATSFRNAFRNWTDPFPTDFCSPRPGSADRIQQQSS
jgi:hypothetical protein